MKPDNKLNLLQQVSRLFRHHITYTSSGNGHFIIHFIVIDLEYRYYKVWMWAARGLISDRDINFIGWNNSITEMNHSRNYF